MFFSRGFCALCFVSLITYPAVLGDTQSIAFGTAFSSLAACAQGCIYTTSLTLPAHTACDLLGQGMGCPINYCSHAQNSCICQPTLQPSATNYLSGCVSSACSGVQANIDSAIVLYANYCLTHGGTLTFPASVSATTTVSSQASSTSTQSSILTQSSTSTQNSTQTTSAPPATITPATTSKTKENTVPIIVGTVVGVLVLVLVLAVSRYIHRRRKSSQDPPAYSSPSAAQNSPQAKEGRERTAERKTDILRDGENLPGTQVSLSDRTAVDSNSGGWEGEGPTSPRSIFSDISNPPHFGPGIAT